MNDEKLADLLERENLQVADKSMRILAWFIDVFLLSFIFGLIHIDTLRAISDSNGNVEYENLRAFIITYSYQMWILKISYDGLFVWYYGSSIGKIICKMRVISVDLLDKPSLVVSLVRALGKYIGENLLFITYLFGLGDVFVRTLHDRVAKTLVVRY